MKRSKVPSTHQPVLPPHNLTRRVTLERVEKQNSSEHWTHRNIHGQVHISPPDTASILTIETVPAERGAKANEINALDSWKPAKVGDIFGPSWATHWFRVTMQLPKDYRTHPLALLFDANGEVAVYRPDGTFKCSLVGGNRRERNVTVLLDAQLDQVLLLEVACNHLFGNGSNGDISPPSPDNKYELVLAKLAAFDTHAWKLRHDFALVAEIAKEADEHSADAVNALRVANHMINVYDRGDKSTWSKASDIARNFFKDTAPRSDYPHIVHAFGHCHIDTAWLWPVAETRRKVVRSWGNMLALQQEYADFNWSFVISQPAQMQMLEQDHPMVFEQVQKAVKDKRIHLVGGSWVEMDGNVPSGEAFSRQFVHGQRYLEKYFGKRTKVFFLPDTFGYASQLPQLANLAGMPYFITQKLSWNLVNKMPHNSFEWEGLDGSMLLTHFPPADTYCAEFSVPELRKTEHDNRSKDRLNESWALGGYGDGGGGINRAMLERLKRVSGCAPACPKVTTHSTPETFFENMKEASNQGLLKRWRGELYFELHQGTFTTHAQVKRRNLYNDIQLRNVELLSVAALIKSPHFTYPAVSLDSLWKLLLLNQFHDTLPGSSIPVVYEDAHADYDAIEAATPTLITPAIDALTSDASPMATPHTYSVLNTTSWERIQTVEIPVSAEVAEKVKSRSAPFMQLVDNNSKALVHTRMPPFSSSHITLPVDEKLQAEQFEQIGTVSMREITHDELGVCIEIANNNVRVIIQVATGAFVELSQCDGSNCLTPGTMSNRFLLYDDLAFFWDAWDTMAYAHEKYEVCEAAEACVISVRGPLRCAVTNKIKVSETSTLTQTISLDAGARAVVVTCDVDWNECNKFLKADFTFDIHTATATYGAAFGHLSRPTHMNTSWDEARHEVPVHGFVDLSECGKGVALLTDAKYGASCYRNGLRLSLLRAPKAPDPNADIGNHVFSYALLPHPGNFQQHVVREAKSFQSYPIVCNGAVELKPPIEIVAHHDHGVIVESVKASEDNDGSIVFRLYESFGGTSTVLLKFGFQATRVLETNLLEDIENSMELTPNIDCLFPVKLGAFKVKTLRVWSECTKRHANGSHS